MFAQYGSNSFALPDVTLDDKYCVCLVLLRNNRVTISISGQTGGILDTSQPKCYADLFMIFYFTFAFTGESNFNFRDEGIHPGRILITVLLVCRYCVALIKECNKSLSLEGIYLSQ